MTAALKGDITESSIQHENTDVITMDGSDTTIKDNLVVEGSLSEVGGLPSFNIRAWVTFDGTDGTILASGNISSVTRDATGQYTFTLTTAMPDINYAVFGSNIGATFANYAAFVCSNNVGKTTTVFKAEIRNSAGSLVDQDVVQLMVVR